MVGLTVIDNHLPDCGMYFKLLLTSMNYLIEYKKITLNHPIDEGRVRQSQLFFPISLFKAIDFTHMNTLTKVDCYSTGHITQYGGKIGDFKLKNNSYLNGS